MGKIIVSMWVTIDGFIAGPHGELNWLLSDDEMAAYEIDLISNTGTLLLGRVTYGNFAGYWPTVASNSSAADFEKEFASKVNALQKIVVSGSLKEASWAPSEIYSAIEADQMEKLKQDSDGNVLIYGSASVVHKLTNLGLIDEYHLLVHPTVLGSGKPLFENIEQRADLHLASAEVFKSGVVVLKYQRNI